VNTQYLWDKSGPPDPDIEKLERVLGTLRFRGTAPAFPSATEFTASRQSVFSSRNWLRFGLAAAFAITLVAAGLGLLWWWKADVQAGWQVLQIAGTPRIQDKLLNATGELGVGQVIETDGASRAEIEVTEIGRIQIDPETRLRVLKAPSGHSRLALDRGTIHARIWALPGNFTVDTPSARAVDLGCAYTLHVDGNGDGLIRTTMGWVGFQFADREAFIPAGAICRTRVKSGPGIPYFEDAPEAFRSALQVFDSPAGTQEDREHALQTILSQSRKQDALSLWHLLSRVNASERPQVYDRFAALVPPPPGVTRDGIQTLDREMLDRWWNALDLGNIWLWRHWERSWSEGTQSAK
jgi:FecR-like protein